MDIYHNEKIVAEQQRHFGTSRDSDYFFLKQWFQWKKWQLELNVSVHPFDLLFWQNMTIYYVKKTPFVEWELYLKLVMEFWSTFIEYKVYSFKMWM